MMPLFWDKYTHELSFQTSWANAYRNDNSRLKNDLLKFWRENRHFEEMTSLYKIDGETKVLDVGCGIATVLNIVKGKKYGIDPLADEYKKIYAYPEEMNIQKGSGENVPFPDSDFDVVFCSNVLDHVTDPRKVIDEIYRVLKPKGHFNLIVELFKEREDRNPAHPHSLIKSDIDLFLKDKFIMLFDKESLWPGGKGNTKGLFRVLEKA